MNKLIFILYILSFVTYVTGSNRKKNLESNTINEISSPDVVALIRGLSRNGNNPYDKVAISRAAEELKSQLQNRDKDEKKNIYILILEAFEEIRKQRKKIWEQSKKEGKIERIPNDTSSTKPVLTTIREVYTTTQTLQAETEYTTTTTTHTKTPSRPSDYETQTDDDGLYMRGEAVTEETKITTWRPETTTWRPETTTWRPQTNTWRPETTTWRPETATWDTAEYSSEFGYLLTVTLPCILILLLLLLGLCCLLAPGGCCCRMFKEDPVVVAAARQEAVAAMCPGFI